MGIVAKSSITLTSISDAYSVLLSPSVCVIHANFDGTNPVLTNAYTLISVYCGEQRVPFSVEAIITSNANIVYQLSKIDDYIYKVAITDLHYALLEGGLDITVNAGSNTTLTGRFLFTIERETTMLDWIQEWENNKTTIGGDSIITPRLFVGKKITGSYDHLTDIPGLTGVYIGPSNNNSCGIYGYKNSIEIFHLDGTGGKIGGWDILDGGLYSSNGRLRILSSGAVYAVNSEGDVIWEVRENGYASFAMENVRFYPNGEAEFTGKITAKEGKIAGWTINDDNLYNIQVGLSSANKYIAIANIAAIPISIDGLWDGNHLAWLKAYGGAAMYYSSSTNYGLIGYTGKSLVFSFGSTNYIAGWSFDESALWLGVKNNNATQYTEAEGSLTIGTKGLRGNAWYIDVDGTASFVKGLVTFGQTSGSIVGWTLTTDKMATSNIALVSTTGSSGIYLTASQYGNFVERGADAMEDFIDAQGGIYLKVKPESADFAAYNANGKKLFKIKSNGISSIAGWSFDNTTLYTGALPVITGFSGSGEMTLGPTGLRGHKWRFENDGSGGIAGDNIKWDANGNVQFGESVSLQWKSIVNDALGNTLTYIDANGIYTGKINANQITTGKINADLLDVEDIFANGQITAAQVLCPFVQINIPDDCSSYCGFNLAKAYNSYFAPSDRGHYIFLPCDIAQSGRTITIHYAQVDNEISSPQIILCNHINARFLPFYRGQDNTTSKIRVIEFAAGQTIQMIAIPHRANMNNADAFVDWYLIGYSDELDNYPRMLKDDIITDSLWTEYHNQIEDII